MKKKFHVGKKLAYCILIIIQLVLLVGIIMTNKWANDRNNALKSQLIYLQDTTNIVQSNLTEMEKNIEARLQEESSLVESYSIQMDDCDFESETYQVHIKVVPKEYSASTQVTIYFGPNEYPLELQGYAYEGTATLSLHNNYDGNVALLFSTGDKKNTEVLQSYVSFSTAVENAISAKMSSTNQDYKDGNYHLDATCDYTLEGYNNLKFSQLRMVVMAGADKVYDYDLLLNCGGAIERPAANADEDGLDEANAGEANAGEANADEANADEANSDEANPDEANVDEEENVVGEDLTAVDNPTDITAALDQKAEELAAERAYRQQIREFAFQNDNSEKNEITGTSGSYAFSLDVACEQSEELAYFLYAKTTDGIEFFYQLDSWKPQQIDDEEEYPVHVPVVSDVVCDMKENEWKIR